MHHYLKAETADFLAVAALDRIAWGSALENQYIPDGEHAWRLWVEYAFVYCCKTEAGEIIGASLAFPAVREKHGVLLAVHKLFVHPDCRHQGIGRRLLDILFEETDRFNYRCFLTVNPVNTPAIKVYESFGFKGSQEVKGYYRANENRLVMLRPAPE